MKKLTARIICNEVALAHNIDPCWVDLFRSDGTWYWGGKAATVFNSAMVAYMKLNDWTLEQWIEDFSGNLDEWQKYQDNTLRDYINGINWELDDNQEPVILRVSKK